MAKNNLPKNKSMYNSGHIEAEECKIYCYKTVKIDLNYKLQLLASEYKKVFPEKGVLKNSAKFT